jgi:hypothetical protein
MIEFANATTLPVGLKEGCPLSSIKCMRTSPISMTSPETLPT